MEVNKSALDKEQIRQMLASDDEKTRIAAFRQLCMEKFDAAEELFANQINPNIEQYRKGDCTLRLTFTF